MTAKGVNSWTEMATGKFLTLLCEFRMSMEEEGRRTTEATSHHASRMILWIGSIVSAAIWRTKRMMRVHPTLKEPWVPEEFSLYFSEKALWRCEEHVRVWTLVVLVLRLLLIVLGRLRSLLRVLWGLRVEVRLAVVGGGVREFFEFVHCLVFFLLQGIHEGALGRLRLMVAAVVALAVGAVIVATFELPHLPFHVSPRPVNIPEEAEEAGRLVYRWPWVTTAPKEWTQEATFDLPLLLTLDISDWPLACLRIQNTLLAHILANLVSWVLGVGAAHSWVWHKARPNIRFATATSARPSIFHFLIFIYNFLRHSLLFRL